MSYEINVSHNGDHFFATTTRSCSTIEETKKVFSKLKEAFPSSEGYKLTVTSIETVGEDITKKFDDIESKKEPKKDKTENNRKYYIEVYDSNNLSGAYLLQTQWYDTEHEALNAYHNLNKMFEYISEELKFCLMSSEFSEPEENGYSYPLEIEYEYDLKNGE